MTGELISVGTELLMGQIVNTDVHYLAQKLNELGVNLYHQSAVGDNMKRLTDAIRLAMSRADLVILSGGLGPTQDDLTKWAVADVLGLHMVEDAASRAHLIELFEKRYGMKQDVTENNFRQVQFPEGAVIFPNDKGTAPGCACEAGEKTIVVLPGPPFELKAMMEGYVVPYLQKKLDSCIASRFIRVFGMGESKLETELRDLIDAQTNPTIAPYAGFIDVSLRVTARVRVGEDPTKLIDPVVEKICARLGDLVYSTDNESMEEVVAKRLAEHRVTLSVAESLTGGMICEKLVAVPGISNYLLEGRVVYSDAAKMRLGVSGATLAEHTSVSAQTVREMAINIKKQSGSDWAVATTGVAGPGANGDGQPEGLYYICIAGPEGEQVLERNGGLGRERIRRHACLTTLNELRKVLEAKRS